MKTYIKPMKTYENLYKTNILRFSNLPLAHIMGQAMAKPIWAHMGLGPWARAGPFAMDV